MEALATRKGPSMHVAVLLVILVIAVRQVDFSLAAFKSVSDK